MVRRGILSAVWPGAAALLILAGVVGLTPAEEAKPAVVVPAIKTDHVPEVEVLLASLKVDKPRTHENMVVFPLRYAGKQAPGDWATMDEAVSAGYLKISEKPQASVAEVLMENTGEKTVFLMSGEIIKGGKQTRVVKQDTIIEAKQKVTVPVFCIERSRWSGGKHFKSSSNMVSFGIQNEMKRGAGQGQVWDRVQMTNEALGVRSVTGSLDEVLDSKEVQDRYERAHKDLGKFSPPETIGIAVADARTGRVVGLELFGRRDLFEELQEKLIEGYATDLVLTRGGPDVRRRRKVTEEDVMVFVRRALKGESKYEDTPGSGRGVDLVSGSMRGKGVALGEYAIHLSVQDQRVGTTPARPIVNYNPSVQQMGR